MEKHLYKYKDMYPELPDDMFLAPGSKIIGDVKIGKGSSIWYNSVVRGDVHHIRIGKKTNIQDLSMLHVTTDTHPLIIGNNVTVGHSVTLHGCTIEDNCLIGMGATVMDAAVIGKNSLVAAGAVVTPGTIIESGKLARGIPAKPVRDLTSDEIEELQNSADRYEKYAAISKKSLEADK